MLTTPAVQSQAMFPPTHIRAPASDNAPSAPTVRAATGDSPAEARGSTYTNPAMSVYVCRTAFLGEHSPTRLSKPHDPSACWHPSLCYMGVSVSNSLCTHAYLPTDLVLLLRCTRYPTVEATHGMCSSCNETEYPGRPFIGTSPGSPDSIPPARISRLPQIISWLEGC